MNINLRALLPAPVDARRWLARIVVVLWAGFWVWFNLASAFGEAHSDGWQALAGHLGMTAILLAVAWLAWTREFAGGLALVGLSALFFWRFQNPLWLGPQWMVPVCLLGPPLVAGLLLLGRRLSRV